MTGTQQAPAARTRTPTPLTAVADGLVAATVGTVAMDALLFARYRRGGGRQLVPEVGVLLGRRELGPGAGAGAGREAPRRGGVRQGAARSASAPGQQHHPLGLRDPQRPPVRIIAGSVRSPRVRYGVPFGASVWATSYAVLPAAKLYRPIWEYDLRTLGKDLSAHLVYGVSTAAAFKLLSAAKKHQP